MKSKQDKTALDLATDEAVIDVIKQAIEQKQVKGEKGEGKEEGGEGQGAEASGLSSSSKDNREENKGEKRSVEEDTAAVVVKKPKVLKSVAASFANDDDVEVDF